MDDFIETAPCRIVFWGPAPDATLDVPKSSTEKRS